ncbi:hypothetical protein [uncultured Aquimarina sp.]|uniref:hypothetical protein n=1 Tax=uncultured Aquimarina sp. TaxID=575652 RepID=UPI002616CC09|nr:hypothetical protein [uncultured Aquimarina sp.]
MIRYLLLILSFISFNLFSQEVIVENDSLILWQKDRKLNWEDFKGQPINDRENVLAEVHGSIKTIKTYWSNGVPKFEIGCHFLKYDSWTVTKDSLSLIHEQVHFDIYELYARKIRKVFCELNEDMITDFKEYQRLFNSYLTENGERNELYDIEVIVNQKKQQEWQAKIAKELEELKEYEYIPAVP